MGVCRLRPPFFDSGGSRMKVVANLCFDFEMRSNTSREG